MKNLIKFGSLFVALALQAQSANLLILRSVVGDERAPIITWQSQSNAVYRIDYADTLDGTNVQWKVLYEDYPSHGTNTFWMDSGNDSFEPAISHPKRKATRFYRIAQTGTNTAAAPFVRQVGRIAWATNCGFTPLRERPIVRKSRIKTCRYIHENGPVSRVHVAAHSGRCDRNSAGRVGPAVFSASKRRH